MNIRFVDSNHYVCTGKRNTYAEPDSKLPRNAKNFWSKYLFNGGLHQKAVVATENGQLVGFFRFEVTRFSNELVAMGTWVNPKYRGKGLGKKLWAKALKNSKTKRVYVTTVSAGGAGLVSAMRRDFPDFEFTV